MVRDNDEPNVEPTLERIEGLKAFRARMRPVEERPARAAEDLLTRDDLQREVAERHALIGGAAVMVYGGLRIVWHVRSRALHIATVHVRTPYLRRGREEAQSVEASGEG